MNTNATKHCLVLGMGYTGCKVIASLAELPGYDELECIALDTDSLALAELPPNVQTMQLPYNDEPSKSISSHKEMICGKLKECGVLICAAGLGGRTGAAVGQILEYADSLHIPALLLAVMPFAFEPEERQRRAESALMQMEVYCRVVLLAPNDDISVQDNVALHAAFVEHTKFLAMAAASLATPFYQKRLFNITPSMYANLVRDASPRCQFLTVEASGSYPSATIVEAVKGNQIFKGCVCDRGLALLRVNGKCLKIELDNVCAMLQKEMRNVSLEFATCVDDALPVTMRLTLLLHTVEAQDFSNGGSMGHFEQSGQLFLEFPDDGRGIFAYDPPNMWNDENVDIPTFIRRKVTIDKGT